MPTKFNFTMTIQYSHSGVTMETIESLGFQVIPRPPHIPDLASRDFFSFPWL